MRSAAIAIGLGAAAMLAAAAVAWAVDGAAPGGELERMPAPGLMTEESGTPPPALRLRAIVSRAWDDSIATWKGLMQARAAEVEAVNLRFVARLAPTNCYGLYAGEGPAYCSGNYTVFVGTDAADRLMARFGPQGEAGITFLIGHEIGHHIQNIHGRFHLLSRVLARAPASRVELMRRFELEADCFAGVWIKASHAWANSSRFRAELIAVLSGIGDDAMLAQEAKGAVAWAGVHGTSEQRTRWFLRGAESGDWRSCNTFSAAAL
jgi:predicted metalloprotease